MKKTGKRQGYRGSLVNKDHDLNDLFEKNHKKALEEIAGNPKLIGLNGTFHPPGVEIPIFNLYEKVGEIDVFLFDPVNEIVYYIEYKCNDSKNTRRKAKKQILIAKEFAEEKYGGKNKRLLYVFGNFNAKELVEGKWKDFYNPPFGTPAK